MSGILNKKTRFIDLIVTKKGREKIAKNNFKITFASLTDKHLSYSNPNHKYPKGGVFSEDTHLTASDHAKLMFETNRFLPSDVIVNEADDSGNVLSTNAILLTSSIVETVNGEITVKSKDKKDITFLTSSAFATTADLFVQNSMLSFKNNMFVKTLSDFENENDFVINVIDNKDTFVMTNSSPFLLGPENKIINVDNADPLMFDSKLSHFKNFKYLPPVNTDGTNYGIYQDLRNTQKETFKDIKDNLRIDNLKYKYLEQVNTVTDDIGIQNVSALNRAPLKDLKSKLSKERIEIYISKTSNQNNLLSQFYEKNTDTSQFKKLDVVDAGEYLDEDDNLSPYKRVFFVGKVYLDSKNIPTFINLFTLIWD